MFFLNLTFGQFAALFAAVSGAAVLLYLRQRMLWTEIGAA